MKKRKIAVEKWTTSQQLWTIVSPSIFARIFVPALKKSFFCFKPRLDPASRWSCTCACCAGTWTAGGPASGGPGRARAGRRAPGGRTGRTDPWTSSSGCSPRCSSDKKTWWLKRYRYKKKNQGCGSGWSHVPSVGDPWHFGADPDPGSVP
jgi:hypothetical protein